jgi:hypothetical protein
MRSQEGISDSEMPSAGREREVLLWERTQNFLRSGRLRGTSIRVIRRSVVHEELLACL